MSEYQYYEFLAIDNPLGEREREELRAVSSRARITTTSFVNTYNWGDLKANPYDLLINYFDLFLYTANWGTQRFALRLPRSAVDTDFMGKYESEGVTISKNDEWLIVGFCAEEADPEYGCYEEGWMIGLAPLRAEILAGDYRSLYLGWLLGVQYGVFEDEDMSPPVPPGLSDLSGPLETLADFLQIDSDLISAAAKWSGNEVCPAPSREEFSAWVLGLSAAEKDSLLEKFIQDEAHHLRAELLKRFREERRSLTKDQNKSPEKPLPTAGQVSQEAERLKAAREKVETEHRIRKEQKEKEKAATERKKFLEELASREEEIWNKVESLVNTKQPLKYDKACQLLKNLHDLSISQSAEAAFASRIQNLRVRHSRKDSFIRRLNEAGLPTAFTFLDKDSDSV